MNQENYQILGVSEFASEEEIRVRYEELKKKYSEERWQDGEAGNEAARMLNKIETAYREIAESRRGGNVSDGTGVLDEVAAAIKNGDLSGAQLKLDNSNDRNAEWHYLQSVLFYRKNWMNESKKQLEIAMQMDPNNAKYKDAYDRLMKRMDYQGRSAYAEQPDGQSQSVHPEENEQMGGNGCSQCLEYCYTCLCINCIFNLCCGCR